MKKQSYHINMTQIMNKCFYPLFIALLVIAGLIISPTTILAQSNCVCAVCGRSCDEISRSGHIPGYSCYVAPSSSGGSGQSLEMQMMSSILAPIFDSMFSSLFTVPDTSVQDEIERQNAIKRQEEEEKKRQAAIQAWANLQNEEALKKDMQRNADAKRGAELVSQMQQIGSGGNLEPFSIGGDPKLDIKPLQGAFPTNKLTTFERLMCSAYFSNMAKQSTKDIDGRFYADQAERVMSGQPTNLECRIPKVDNEKIATRMEEVKKIYEGMNVKIKDLQTIENRLIQAREKIKDAESKKEEATTKLKEIEDRAATALPEEKEQLDLLGLEAQKLLQDAEQELNQAKESEKDELNKKDQIQNDITNMQTLAKANIQAGSE